MSFEEIQKELLAFGFKDITKEWYEPWKVQTAFRFGNTYYVIFDTPNVEFFKNSTQIDNSIGVTITQLKGLFAYLSLSYNDRDIIKGKKLHLDELYSEIKNDANYFDREAYRRFIKKYDQVKFKYLDEKIRYAVTE